MNQRRQTILEAAIAVFSRYGIRKATMGDIAEHAGLSRQTLYSHYASKDDILAASMDLLTDRTIDDVTAGWDSANTIGEKLDVYFDCAVTRYFEQVKQMPDSEDLLASYGPAGEQPGEGRKTQMLRDLFESSGEALARKGTTVPELAEFVFVAASGFKFTARDRAHLDALLATLKRIVLDILGES